ncbi:MAG: sugar phosphate nucleotidyltransferase [Polyangiaceae bacterium]
MSNDEMARYQAVIFCGGQGTRIRAVADDRPKPMVEIGGRPILWHIMKAYSARGVRRFILALGYRGEGIVEYFERYHSRHHDFTMRVGSPTYRQYHHPSTVDDADVESWEITFAYTGVDTNTGGRLLRVRHYIDQDHFFCTYGDGLSDVDVRNVLETHVTSGSVGTLVGVHLPTTFGVVEADNLGTIRSFREKPVLPGHINGGFFCFTPEVFDFIDGEDTALEDAPFRRLAEQERLSMYPYDGFWHAMDHYKDYVTLNKMWTDGAAPWKVW